MFDMFQKMSDIGDSDHDEDFDTRAGPSRSDRGAPSDIQDDMVNYTSEYL